MVNYQNGKIYSIRSYQTDLIYIGSTCNVLSKRFAQHKAKYRYYKNDNSKIHTASVEILKYDDAYLELICSYPCNNRAELSREEGNHIRNNNCVNKNIAGRNKREYYLDNRDKRLQYKKQYYLDNKDKINDKRKQYYLDNKDKIKQYYLDNKNKNKDKNK